MAGVVRGGRGRAPHLEGVQARCVCLGGGGGGRCGGGEGSAWEYPHLYVLGIMGTATIKPIFHQVCFGRVWGRQDNIFCIGNILDDFFNPQIN